MKKLFLAIITIVMFGNMTTISAKESQQSVPGVFDYYLLTLSWSPTYCLTHRENEQCSGKGYGFVLHGLWPQYASGGWPQDCPPVTPLTQDERIKGETLFPTGELLNHEWAKHGTCSGMGAIAYFNTADKAVSLVKVPPEFQPSATPHYFTAKEIIQLFRQSNPAIPENGTTVQCSGPDLAEVRVCLAKDLSFTSCGKGVKTQCHPGEVRVTPVR